MSLVDEIYRRCLDGPSKGGLTAQNVSLYHASPFTIFCEAFVSAEKKDPMSPYRELLLERGREHERRVIDTAFPSCRRFHYETPEEGFRRLLNEMASGVEVISGPPLFYLPENMRGRIDVLEKRSDHYSVFGNYYYIVTEIKQAKRIKKEHILQGAFYTYVLAKIQEHLPGIFRIINHDLKVLEYSFSDYEAELQLAMKGTQAIIDGIDRPTATYNAAEWPWERYINHEAIRMRDVSLVGQVGPRTKEKLVSRGFKKIWDISSARVESLQTIQGISETAARKLILNAKAIMKNEPIPIDLSGLNFPGKSIEIFLDMEGTDEPDLEGATDAVDYLIGVIVRTGGRDEYHPFIAPKIEDEGEMFYDFMSFLKKHSDYIIYHWHNYEHWHMKRLAQRHNLVEEADTLVLSHMVDLHRIATRAFAFPTYTNGLKDIAAFLGFKWRHGDINALDAIAYYLKYQTDPDGYLEKIQAVIDYNEDDCRATKTIKDWLAEQKNIS
ncbi:MAG: TM0106 family RecB-like putative nuclease [Syntrophales bacterium]